MINYLPITTLVVFVIVGVWSESFKEFIILYALKSPVMLQWRWEVIMCDISKQRCQMIELNTIEVVRVLWIGSFSIDID